MWPRYGSCSDELPTTIHTLWPHVLTRVCACVVSTAKSAPGATFEYTKQRHCLESPCTLRPQALLTLTVQLAPSTVSDRFELRERGKQQTAGERRACSELVCVTFLRRALLVLNPRHAPARLARSLDKRRDVDPTPELCRERSPPPFL